jgi:hypothetical protein
MKWQQELRLRLLSDYALARQQGQFMLMVHQPLAD